MRNLRLSALAALFLAVGLAAAIARASQPPKTAYPGTVNYGEGQVSIGSQNLGATEIGSVRLEPQQTLTTADGKAEVLLTPGVFLRLGDRSAVEMISPSLTNTEVALNHGEATIEVASIYPQNRIVIDEGRAKTRLLKVGFYDFDADRREVRVFSGKAELQDGDRSVTIKSGHEVTLDSPNLKAQSFDKKASEDELYQWSSLRSSYLAQANADIAPQYYVNGYWSPGWLGSGWYWNPWFGGYTFLPADGIFYSPFGWGFFSPAFIADWGSPYYYAGGHYHHFDPHARTPERFGHAWGGPRGTFDRGGAFHPGVFARGGVRGNAGSGVHIGQPSVFPAGRSGGFGGGGFHGGGSGGFGRR